MKNIILVIAILFLSIVSASAQCSNTPVKEAVRNGDFEAGYLTGSGSKHTSTAGSDFDFYSDMDFKGQNKSGTGAGTCSCCQYGMGDGYVVAKAENFTCAGTNFVDNTYWGISYGGDKSFKDHTAGLSGKGHALLVDLNGRSSSPKTGGLPIAWEQTVDIYPSQNYWFSAYVANFSTGTAPVMQVTIIPRKNGVDQTADKVTLPATGAPAGLMNWTQMTAQWNPTKVFDQAIVRFEFVNVSGGSSGLDVAIDDISFINSCQNFATQKKPTFPADSVNLCSTAGSATLTATYPTSGNETITWFEGTGATQTVIAGVSGLTHTVSQPGTYRICVQDPDNSCAVNATVVVYKDMKLSLPDVTLCSPSTASVNVSTSLTPSGSYTKAYTWTVPAGVTNPGNSGTATFTTSGSYSVTVSNPGVTGCSATDNFTLDASKLPKAPNNLRFCSGGGTAVSLSVGDGKSYAWSTSSTMTPLIGTGATVNWTPATGTTGNQTLYIQSTETSPLGTTGPTLSTSSSAATSLTTSITANEAVLLKTVQMGQEAWTGACGAAGSGSKNVTIQLLSGATVVSTKSVAVPCGALGSVTLDMVIPAGSYSLRASGGGNLMSQMLWSGAATTYNIGTSVNITAYSAHYGAFGQMVFEKSNACDPLPVIVKDSSCCTQLAPTVAGAAVVCVGGAVTLTATKNAATTGTISYQWYNDAGAITGATSATYVVPTTASAVATNYWATVTSSASCSGESPISNKVSVTINPNPTKPTITIAPNKTTFCAKEVHTLTAASTVSSGTLSYTWSKDGSAVVAAQVGKSATAGTYTYKVVVAALGCKDSLEQIITVSPLDSADLTSTSISSCSNSGNLDLASYKTAGTSAGTFSGTGVTGTNFNTAIAAGTYKVLYTTSGTCSKKDSLNVVISGKAVAQITTADTTVCFKSKAFPIKLSSTSATDGTWKGTGVSAGTFTPGTLAAGIYKIKYAKIGSSAACSDSDSISITIKALDIAKIAQLPSLCSTDPSIQLTLDGTSTTGGVWKDSLATNTYVNVAGLFNPTGLADKKYKVYYATTSACPGIDSGYVSVVSNIKYTLQHTKTTYCKNYGLDTLKVDKAGGEIWTFSGKGVVNKDARAFNTNLMDVGIDTIYYGKAGACGDTIKMAITISPIDFADIDSVKAVCSDTISFNFALKAGSTPGGTWSGKGITDATLGTFSAATAGSGTHSIKYKTPGTCFVTDSVKIVVNTRLDATITMDTTAFCGVASPALAKGKEAGGTWTWKGALNPLSSTTTQTIKFTPSSTTAGVADLIYTRSGSCPDADTVSVTVSAMEVAKIDSLVAICEDAGKVTFKLKTGGTTGGTWSGTGINASTGEFDPAVSGDGKFQIKYQTPGGCFVRDSVHIVVKPRVNATLDKDSIKVCQGAAVQTATGVDVGGTWSGWTGAHLTSVTKTMSFDPSKSGAGAQYVHYRIPTSATVCGDSDSVFVRITAKDSAEISGLNLFCQADAPTAMTLTAGSTTGGTWSGLGVNATTGVFNPSTAGLGIGSANKNKITYTTSGSCPETDDIDVEIVSQVVVDINLSTSNLLFCGNASSQFVRLTTASTSNGRVWSSVPAGFVNTSTGELNVSAMAANTAVTKYTIKCEINVSANCKDQDEVIVEILPVPNPSISNKPTGKVCMSGTYDFNTSGTAGGTWSITRADGSPGGTIDPSTGVVSLKASGAGDFKVSYDFGQPCPISDNANISIEAPKDSTINPAGPFCENLGLQTLTPVLSGGTWSGNGVNGNGEFNPSVGPGSHVITYTQVNSCTSTGSITIEVLEKPQIDVIPDITGGCEPQTVVYTDNSSATATATKWTFDDGSTSNNLGSATKTYNGGNYGLTIEQTFSNGCVDSRNYPILVMIDKKPLVDFSFSPERTSVLDPNIKFTNLTTGGSQYAWTFDRNSIPSVSTEEHPFVSFLSEQGDTFNICLEATNGACKADTCKDVIILNNVSVYVPNSFTPNGDGLNDVFYPNGKFHNNPEGLDKFEFIVFNRWGEQVFRSTTPYKGWDGTFNGNGEFVQTDVYVWKLKVWDMANQKEIVTVGHVTKL